MWCARGRISSHCRQVTSKVPKTVKNLFVIQCCSWGGSFRHDEMKIWLCLYFQHVTRYLGTDFVEESRRKCKDQKRSIFSRRVLWQMGWRTRTSALLIRDLCQIAYLLPKWGGIWSSVVFLWRRLICPQNSSLRMFWYGDLNSSHFFPRFGWLEHETKRTPLMSATFIGSHKTFSKHNRMSVCPARKRKSSILAVSLVGWIVSVGAAQEELRPFKFCAKIRSARGTRKTRIKIWIQHKQRDEVTSSCSGSRQ